MSQAKFDTAPKDWIKNEDREVWYFDADGNPQGGFKDYFARLDENGQIDESEPLEPAHPPEKLNDQTAVVRVVDVSQGQPPELPEVVPDHVIEEITL